MTGRRRQFVSLMVERQDRERINALADQLTKDGPGRFGQAETVRYLLDARAEMAILIRDLLGARDADDLDEQLRDGAHEDES